MAAALTLAVTGCGYSLAGRGAFLPEYIQVIGVPLLENQTPVFNIEQIITDKIRAEFIGRGRYRVLPEAAGADAVLLGRIIDVALVPIGFTDQQQVSRYEVRVTAGFRFEDLRAGKVLWENLSVVFREEYEVTTGIGALDPNAFFGQETTAIDRLSSVAARAVVTAILEAF
jgi:hypothetical protein